MSFFPRVLPALAFAAETEIEWEEANCLLCGGRRWSQVMEGPDTMPGSPGLWFAVVQCQECGLCFTNPRPSEGSIEHFYPAAYWPRRAPSPRERKGDPAWPGRRWQRLRQERRTVTWYGRGRLLDFGCGGGTFLQRMHRLGWAVTGLDMSAAAAERIRAHLHLPVLEGSLPHPDLEPASFDVITMWHSLEHVHRPRQVLQGAFDLLAPGGRLLVAVPNIDCLPFHWFRESWYGLDLPRHLTHFSPRTLQWMLERSGFRVQSLRMVGRSGWLRSSARQAHKQKGRGAGGQAREGRGQSWLRWLQARPASSLAAWYTSLTHQADNMIVTAERMP
jgi:2-polyprenyl-3-methyl-5-hydroxy-6-metoxy-1,4-benzoquinol methylase